MHYRGEEAGAFPHKHFQKDRLELVEKMTCFKEGDKPEALPKREEKIESLVSRTTPVAAMEALPSRIADALPPLPLRFLSSMSGWSVNPSMQQSELINAPGELNAAIEIEGFNSTAVNFAALNVGPDQRQRLSSMPVTTITIAKTA
jgi:hypothetical protein